jgi:hypothetical protein
MSWHRIAMVMSVAALAAGCFHPVYDRPACGPGGQCPEGFTCSAVGFCEQVSSPMVDASVDAPDASVDAPDDAASTGCLDEWRNGTVRLSDPQTLASLTTAGDDRGPWISSDGRTLYFSSDRDGDTDVYRADRTSPTFPFGPPTKLINLSVGTALDGGPSLTADETLLVLFSSRGSTRFEVYVTSRPNRSVDFGSPHQDHLAAVNGGTDDLFDPFVTADGRGLYLAPDPLGPARQRIVVATRLNTSSDFSEPVDVPGINISSGSSASPAVSIDERVIVFRSDRAGGLGQFDLWYATRPSAAQGFGTPVVVPTVNTDKDDADPMLSADGCELYFSSRRAGDYDLFVAHVVR